MIAITTNNSTSVKPDLVRLLALISNTFSRNVRWKLIHRHPSTTTIWSLNVDSRQSTLELWNKICPAFARLGYLVNYVLSRYELHMQFHDPATAARIEIADLETIEEIKA